MKQLSMFDAAPPSLLKDYTQWRLCVDGASRNNPGLSGAGIVIYKNDELVMQRGYFLGTKTNNQAEYLALVVGLFLVLEQIHADDMLLIVSDSELLVKQMRGVYRVKNEELKPLHAVAQRLLTSVNYDIGHVLRADNEAADAMANAGVDKRTKVPERIVTKLHEQGIYL